MRTISAVWNFSRPHTIAGSIISITSLYIILSTDRYGQIGFLALALLAGITSNLFIVGINQIADVDIDRINKPWLPIPAQRLSIQRARNIVFLACVLSLVLAMYTTPWFFLVIAAANTIGWAYSMPPFRLKRHHLTAAFAISFVRGVLVNLGAYIVFASVVQHETNFDANLIPLTLFITVCGVAIAWLKDLPDVRGDSAYNVKTMAVVYSPKVAFAAATGIMCAVYVVMISVYATSWIPSSSRFSNDVLLYGHLVLLIVFIAHAFTMRFNKPASVAGFYKRFWIFFFAEYLLYSWAYF